MRQKTYSDKQREAQQQKKQEEDWARKHSQADAEKVEETEKKENKIQQPERRSA